MEVLASLAAQKSLDLQTSSPPAKRTLMDSTHSEMVKKRRLMSADSFCFSLEDLTSRLYSKHDSNTVRSDQEDSADEDGFCFWCDAKRYKVSFECPYHGNVAIPNKDKENEEKKKPYAYENIPSMLQLYSANTPDGVTTGIRVVHTLPAGAWIGPFEGTLVKREDVPLRNNYMWEIFKDGKLHGYIDGSDVNKSSWMRFIRRARHKEEQNLGAFQYQEKIYYRAHKAIRPGQELLVWYDQEYVRFLGMPGKDATKEEDKQGVHPQTTTPPNSAQEQTVDQQRKDVLHKLKGIAENNPKPHAPTSGQIQMETSFTRIGALIPSPTKATNQTETVENSVITDPTPAKPIPRVSTGFSLKIANGEFTRTASTSPEKDRQSPSTPTLPNPTSPATPNSSESEFSFDSVSAESPNKNESNGTSVWRCGQCQKSFPQRVMLQVHVCSKVPFRPYKCGHCDRSFSTSGQMRAHAVVHQGKKPFKCGYCSRAFSGATTLNNHIRIHTGEKPFKCEKCGKIFSQGSQLSKHEKIPGDCIE